MHNLEMSALFDILYNNVTSNQAPGLNEMEKSVFLTKAQNMLVSDYFNGRIDGVGGGFDGSERRQYDFSRLIKTMSLFDLNTFKERVGDTEKLDRRSRVYLFPQDYFLAVNEVLFDSKRQYSVIPLSYEEYQRLMLKPYNFPVKRGAWRLFTNKKGCNVWSKYLESDEKDDYGGSVTSKTGYTFASGWAGGQRKLKIAIRSYDHWDDKTYATSPDDTSSKIAYNDFIEDADITYSDGTHPRVYAADKYMICGAKFNGSDYYTYRVVVCDSGWGDGFTYNVALDVYAQSYKAGDDEEVVEDLKTCFTLLKYYITSAGLENEDWKTIKAMNHTDGFIMASAPSKFAYYQDDETNDYNTFTTEVREIPTAEIIGKFSGDVTYQLRYVETLKPVILDDLTNYGEDVSIDGYTQVTECELPKEMHQEIVERAVALAKIAWQGGTATQAAAQQSGRNQNDQ